MHAVSLKMKSGSKMARAIAKIIRDDRRCPKNFQIDMEKKFYNANVQNLLKKHINHYSTYSIMKASVIEWFNHILRKQFTCNENYKWINLRVSCRSICAKASNYRYAAHVTPTITELLIMMYNRIKKSSHLRDSK